MKITLHGDINEVGGNYPVPGEPGRVTDGIQIRINDVQVLIPVDYKDVKEAARHLFKQVTITIETDKPADPDAPA